jgi:hypothetical protein
MEAPLAPETRGGGGRGAEEEGATSQSGAAAGAGMDTAVPPPPAPSPEEPVWPWRTGAFVGEFLDAYVKDTELEGGLIAAGLDALAAALGEVTEQLPDAAAVAAVAELRRHLHDAAAASSERRKCGSPADFLSYLRGYQAALRRLRPLEYLVMPGGWRQKNGGHVILYVYQRHGDGTFSLTVCNTGAWRADVRVWRSSHPNPAPPHRMLPCRRAGGGIQYHPTTTEPYPKQKTLTALHLGGIDPRRITSEAYLYTICKVRGGGQEGAQYARQDDSPTTPHARRPCRWS